MNITTGRLTGLALLAALAMGGCNVTLTPSGGGTNVPTTPTTISIKILNETSKPLDPQVYIGSLDAGTAGLFVSANKRTSFGLGNLGIMEPYTTATLTIDCGQLGYFGTAGGAFGSDLMNPDGLGPQRIVQEGALVQCGDTITLKFDASGKTLTNEMSITHTVE